MQVVTFETAQKLKEAGFPQPEIDQEQFWYDGPESKYFISFCGHWVGVTYIEGPYSKTNRVLVGAPADIFAPTATDILRQLPSHLSLTHDTGEFWCGEEKDCNPAEACAAAWLALKEK